uniref:Uncharacterized protein n=1 Tax=Anguilla anguilla TaxID=7936 RepID=A0A0E9VSM4_ANGAN
MRFELTLTVIPYWSR